MPTTGHVLIVGLFLCGVLMAVGGVALALRGTVEVRRPREEGGSSSALRLEFRGLKVSTDYQAIAVSLVGVLFAGLAGWMELNQTITMNVTAQLEGGDPAGVTVFAAVPLVPVLNGADGQIQYEFSYRPFQQHKLYLVTIAPGSQAPTAADVVPAAPLSPVRSANVGPVKLLRTTPRPPPSSTIEPIPTPADGQEKRGNY